MKTTNRTKGKSRLSLLVSVIISICILSAFTMTAFADTEANTKAAGNSLVKINVDFTDNNGSKTTVKQGTGFFIDTGTLITASSVVELNDSDVDAYRDVCPGIEENWDNTSKISYTIYIEERPYAATLKYIRPKTGFAALTYDSTTVNNQPYVALGDSNTLTDQSTNKNISAVGFSTGFSLYNPRNGIVKEISNYNVGQGQAPCFIHDSKFTDADRDLYVGSPLVDSNGIVIGLNTAFDKDGNTVSVAINVIKADLDLYNDTNYHSADGTAAAEEPATTEAPAAAEITDSTAETTQPVVTATTDPKVTLSTDNTSDTEDKGFFAENWKLIVLIGGGVVVVVLVVVILVTVTKKPKAAATSNGSQSTVFGGTPTPSGATNTPVPTPTPFKQTNTGSADTTVLQTTAGETSVLGGEAGATTVLGQQMPSASLKKNATGETVSITAAQFAIGKDSSKVNYCISNNGSVSRRHCVIALSNGAFSIMDLNSTNGTFLNDVRLNPRQAMPLKDGDKIKISDVEFTFIKK